MIKKIIIMLVMLKCLLFANIEILTINYDKNQEIKIDGISNYVISENKDIYKVITLIKDDKELNKYISENVMSCQIKKDKNVLVCNNDRTFFLTIIKDEIIKVFEMNYVGKQKNLDLKNLENKNNSVKNINEIEKEKDYNNTNINLFLNASEDFNTIYVSIIDKRLQLLDFVEKIKNNEFELYTKMYWFLTKVNGVYKMQLMLGLSKNVNELDTYLGKIKKYYNKAYISKISFAKLEYYQYNPVFTNQQAMDKINTLENQLKKINKKDSLVEDINKLNEVIKKTELEKTKLNEEKLKLEKKVALLEKDNNSSNNVNNLEIEKIRNELFVLKNEQENKLNELRKINSEKMYLERIVEEKNKEIEEYKIELEKTKQNQQNILRQLMKDNF